jgi:putative spermidine/putrescine transport system substrate-binding protein
VEKITRRGFLGLSGGVLGASVMAACGSGSGSGSGGKIVASEWGGNWDIALQKVSPGFTKKTGIELVNAVTASSLTKVGQSPGQYDLAWLIGSDAVMGVKNGTLSPIDTAKVSALSQVNSTLTDSVTVDGKLCGVPISYGATGIVWRKDKVPFEITSWKDLWRPELKGQITVQNAPSIGGLFLVYAAARAFGSGPTDYDAGWAAIERLRANVQYLYTVSSDPLNKLSTGDVAVAVTFADYGIPLASKNVVSTIPAEGAPWSLQNITIPAKAKNPDKAYQFINYMLEQDTQVQWADSASIAPAKTGVELPAKVQSKVLETAAVAKTIWPIDWQELAGNIKPWTQRWQKIFTS